MLLVLGGWLNLELDEGDQQYLIIRKSFLNEVERTVLFGGMTWMPKSTY